MEYKILNLVIIQMIRIIKNIFSVNKNRCKYFFIILIFLSCDLILYTNVDEYEKANNSNLYASDTKNLYASISRSDVKLYGNTACFFCLRLKKELNREGIPYIFYNVSESENRNEEMKRKFIKAFPDANVVHFPMVEVKGKILMRPSLKEIRSYLLY